CARLPNPAASDSFVALRADTDIVNVPLLDLVAQYRAIKDDVLPAVQAVIESQQFVMGPSIPRLETAIAGLGHAKHGITCASGTCAARQGGPLSRLDGRCGTLAAAGGRARAPRHRGCRAGDRGAAPHRRGVADGG